MLPEPALEAPDPRKGDPVEPGEIVPVDVPAQSAGVLLGLGRFLAPGIGTAPLAITQFRATWLGSFPPYFSPMRRSSATTPSTTSIGWLEKFRLPGGGLEAEYLPVRRPWPIGE